MTHRPFPQCLALCACLITPALGLAAAPADISPLAKLPVREITVFKDGHAFLLREGTVPTGQNGDVTLGDLPIPVLGTFWPYSGDARAKLTAVVAGRQPSTTARTATSIRDLLAANPGASVQITDISNTTFEAVVIGIPGFGATGAATPEPLDSGIVRPIPERASIVLLKQPTGATLAFPIDRIQSVAFHGDFHPAVSENSEERRLTMRLQWSGGRADTAQVGMVYLEKGIRWLPSYKIDLDGKGHAHVQLEATLVDDLIDLSDVTANLVIGVPTFAMAGLADPISLQDTAAQLSPLFDQNSRSSFAFSNAIAMKTQYAASAEADANAPDPSVAGASGNEDLFVFKVAHLTLKKGQRMVVPISDYTIAYSDIYTLDLPASPPLEVRQYLNNGAYNSGGNGPKFVDASPVMHKIRLVNSNNAPLTTAPALALRDGRLIAQGLMTYAAIGATTDLAITPAVNIKVLKNSRETKRTPSAGTWQGNNYERVDIAGTLTVANYENKDIDLEVTRQTLGTMDSATAPGKIEQLSALDSEDAPPVSSYDWWSHFNGVGKAMWKVRMTPKQRLDLGYAWHYFVR